MAIENQKPKIGSVPPPLPSAAPARVNPADKTLRTARLFNLFLPGAGLVMLGQRAVGGMLAGAFLFCFAGVLGVFLHGYAHYLKVALSENLLEGNKLEEAAAGFHQNWTFGFLGAGLVLYLISAWLFSKAKRDYAAKRGS